MAATSLAALLRHERATAAAALALLIVAAWTVTVAVALDMRGMVVPANGQWTPGHFSATFATWSVMMAAMMLPGAAPAILLQAPLRHQPARAALLFAAGYLVCWSVFGLLATVAQWAFATGGVLSSAAMIRVKPVIAAGLFLLAGIYQVTPLKRACLTKCRSSAALLASDRHGPFGPLVMGLEHGLACVGCCWALMALMFALGAMNLAWAAALAVFALAEKGLRSAEPVRCLGAAGMLAASVWLLWTTSSLSV